MLLLDLFAWRCKHVCLFIYYYFFWCCQALDLWTSFFSFYYNVLTFPNSMNNDHAIFCLMNDQ